MADKHMKAHSMSFSSVQLISRVWLFATPWAAARQASLSNTNSRSPLMSTESVMPSNHLILCHPLLLLPSFFPSIRVSSRSLGKYRSKSQWDYYTSTRIAVILKRHTIEVLLKMWTKWNPHTSLVGMNNAAAILVNNLEVPQSLKHTVVT